LFGLLPRLFAVHFEQLRLKGEGLFVCGQAQQSRRLLLPFAGVEFGFREGCLAFALELLPALGLADALSEGTEAWDEFCLLEAHRFDPGDCLAACALIKDAHGLLITLERLAGLFGLVGALVGGLGDLPIDRGPGDFLEQFGAGAGVGLEEAGELALGEQHRAEKAIVVQSGELGDLPLRLGDFLREDLTGGKGDHLAAGILEFSVGLLVRPLTLPKAAEAAACAGEVDLRPGFAGVAAHDGFRAGGVAVACDAAIERQRDGVEQGGLACARLAGDGEEAPQRERRTREVDLQLPSQGVEVAEAQSQDSHAAPSSASE